MARGWKRYVEFGLARMGPSALAMRRERPTSIVLAYHNIVPRGERAVGDLSLHLDQSDFAAQLDFILDHARVVPLSEATAAREEGDRELRVAVTFDDAYLGTMTAGVDELTRRGLPCTVFVPPGLIGGEGFWWDRIAPEGGLPEEARSHALGALRGEDGRVLDWAVERGLKVRSLPPHARPADEDFFDGETLSAGVTLGAHTWTHPNLAQLEEGEIEKELGSCREWLAPRGSAAVAWLAYPYGLYDERVVRVAARHFEGALAVTGGALERRGRFGAGAHETPRVNVPRGLSLEGLHLRLSGLL